MTNTQRATIIKLVKATGIRYGHLYEGVKAIKFWRVDEREIPEILIQVLSGVPGVASVEIRKSTPCPYSPVSLYIVKA